MRGHPRIARYAAPVAFLALLTIAVLLVRSGVRSAGGGATTGVTTTAPARAATTAKRTSTHRTTTRRTTTGSTTTTAAGAAQYTTVQSGDTYGSIAAANGTTVQQLEALNPGVSPTSLSVGQKIRIK